MDREQGVQDMIMEAEQQLQSITREVLANPERADHFLQEFQVGFAMPNGLLVTDGLSPHICLPGMVLQVDGVGAMILNQQGANIAGWENGSQLTDTVTLGVIKPQIISSGDHGGMLQAMEAVVLQNFSPDIATPVTLSDDSTVLLMDPALFPHN